VTGFRRAAVRATRIGAAGLLSAALLTGTVGSAGLAQPAGALPDGIQTLMHKPRYANATWNLLVTDLATGKTVYELNPDRLAFTGSVRKLFSVGLALNALGAKHQFVTPVYRRGAVDGNGALKGDLVLVASGDLTFGGRLQMPDWTVAYTNFDHNDANNLGTAILTPQDPLHGLDVLARMVRTWGIRSVKGDVIVDDRLFQSYRVPNGNLLVTPILLNENMVDVSATPTQVGKPATVTWRPKTAAFGVKASVTTIAAGKPDDITFSDDGLMKCKWPAACEGTVTGGLPVGYVAPLSGSSTYVHVFRVEEPATFARIAFVQALQRAGVSVGAPLRAPNAPAKLPPRGSYTAAMQVAQFVSPAYSEFAKLILKVSLNLGANLSLSLFGLTQGERTVTGALAAERKTLVGQMGIKSDEFAFPTNGSGSPDSQAAPRATVKLLAGMYAGKNGALFKAALPILGVDGSLAGTGGALPAKGHVFAKTGTTVDSTGLKAQVLAGYIDSKSGRHLAFALYVNDAGPIKSIADVAGVFQDEAEITNEIYQAN
jgi:D-alanyl-D-alanine carboxypeptidase/D-alanyl-D-alanine-endopeptidase (penicillin-binding protein 4)